MDCTGKVRKVHGAVVLHKRHRVFFSVCKTAAVLPGVTSHHHQPILSRARRRGPCSIDTTRRCVAGAIGTYWYIYLHLVDFYGKLVGHNIPVPWIHSRDFLVVITAGGFWDQWWFSKGIQEYWSQNGASCTLPETNIAPKSDGFQQESPFPGVPYFKVLC